MVLIEINERHKLDPLYKGPYKVKSINEPNIVITNDKGEDTLIHKDKVKNLIRIFIIDS